jgi:curli biogenesis system outer membrane secretion channel CsgG
MTAIERVACIVGAVLLLTVGAAAQVPEAGALPAMPQQVSPPPPAQETSFEVSGRYTAQRRPRVTVLSFDDTNAEAQSARYGSSVEAMLVTFLKRKSQFVVVERQNLRGVFEERQRIQKGMIDIDPGDTAARELLEKIDAFVLGNVTLLNIPTDQTTAAKNPEEASGEGGAPGSRRTIQGPRIEVDAKLLSRFDGRIIAAAQRSGPVACLRSIVERLGVALEQDFLRPYYGKLKVNLNEPENVRIFLTPILLDNALDEEKPPVERGSTVTIGGDLDHVEPWMTDPTTYTIESLLSGWYSMRLERSGYEELRGDAGRWEARDRFGQVEIYDRTSERPLGLADPGERRFVVRVDPLTTEVIDGDALGFVFRKQGGSVAPRVKRQYLDADFSHTPQRVLLMGGKDIDLNQSAELEEFGDDQKCNLFEPKRMVVPNYGRTYIASGQQFDFDKFKGGELIIEDYHGEKVPVGQYLMALWEPSYQVEKSPVSVRDRDEGKVTRTTLTRETMTLKLDATGPRPANRVILEGRETHYRLELPLDFTDTKEQRGLPADVYTASTNISGLDAWQQTAEVRPGSESPPMYYTRSPVNEPKITHDSGSEKKTARAPRLTVKTRFVVGGRLDAFSRPPDPLAADVFIDRDLMKILNLLLYGQEERLEEEKGGGFLKAVGRSAVRILAETIIPAGAPGSAGTAGGSADTSKPQAAGPPAQTAALAASSGAEETSPTEEDEEPPPQLPRDPDELRRLLARHLEAVDLLVLDPRDMAELRRSPEVAPLVERYVKGGGALFAFVTETGDYGDVLGAPLVIEAASKPTDRFNLTPGEVPGVVPRFDKKVDVKSKRALPELAKLAPQGLWRVIAFTQGHKDPRIVERGKREDGGYVALWLDDPGSYRGRLGGTVSQVEEMRRKVEERILEWARYLMYRRYDKAGEERRQAEKTLLR